MLDGKKLREKRFKKGWTMAELSCRSGIAMSRIQDYESGKRTNLELYSLLRLCNTLGCRVDDVIDYDAHRDGE